MNESRLPTNEEIEILISYLPRLYAEGFNPVVNWNGGEKGTGGVISLPYPRYDPLVQEFFDHVAGDGWMDYQYVPEQASAMIRNEKRIENASLEQIQTMLTFCIRGERFADGHWAEMIEKGYIRRLLERLAALKAQQ